jgi:hypothetical protein
MTTRKLDKTQWRTFFDRLSTTLEGKQAEVEITSLRLGAQLEADWLPLLGIAYDPNDDLVEVALEGFGSFDLHTARTLRRGGTRRLDGARNRRCRRRQADRQASRSIDAAFAIADTLTSPVSLPHSRVPHRETQMLRPSVVLLAALTASGATMQDAAAELLSSRPITVVIPFTPGASSDTLQRIVSKKVTENTGQTLVVESRPGGSGIIAAAVVKQAPPDGHTLLQANAATHASTPRSTRRCPTIR